MARRRFSDDWRNLRKHGKNSFWTAVDHEISYQDLADFVAPLNAESSDDLIRRKLMAVRKLRRISQAATVEIARYIAESKTTDVSLREAGEQLGTTASGIKQWADEAKKALEEADEDE